MRNALGEFEQLVMLAVLHLGDGAYGVEIVKALEDRTGRPVSRSALYVTFDRLEAKAMLESRLADGGSVRGGRPRRYVTVTPLGLTALRASRDAFLNMWRGLESLLEDR